MRVSDQALLVEEVEGGPVDVAVRIPDFEIIIHDHRVANPQLGHRLAYVLSRPLMGELRGVDSNDGEALGSIRLVPGFQPGHDVQAVIASRRPHFDGDNFPLERSQMQLLPSGVKPGASSYEVRSRRGRQGSPSGGNHSYDRDHGE